MTDVEKRIAEIERYVAYLKTVRHKNSVQSIYFNDVPWLLEQLRKAEGRNREKAKLLLEGLDIIEDLRAKVAAYKASE